MAKVVKKSVQIEDLVVDTSLEVRLDDRSADYIDQLVNSSGTIPPIVVDQNNRILDGIHRLRAYALSGEESVEVEVIEVEDEITALAEAAHRNSTHGNPLSSEEKKQIAIKLYKGGMSKQKDIAEVLQVTKVTVGRYLAELNEQIKAEQRDKAVILYLGNMGQSEVARILSEDSPRSITQGTVSEYLKEHLFSEVVERYDDGQDLNEIIESLKEEGFKRLLGDKRIAEIRDHLDEHIAQKEVVSAKSGKAVGLEGSLVDDAPDLAEPDVSDDDPSEREEVTFKDDKSSKLFRENKTPPKPRMNPPMSPTRSDDPMEDSYDDDEWLEEDGEFEDEDLANDSYTRVLNDRGMKPPEFVVPLRELRDDVYRIYPDELEFSFEDEEIAAIAISDGGVIHLYKGRDPMKFVYADEADWVVAGVLMSREYWDSK